MNLFVLFVGASLMGVLGMIFEDHALVAVALGLMWIGLSVKANKMFKRMKGE